MRMLGSLVLRVADETRVPAGGALAVDREVLPRGSRQIIRTHPNITIHSGEVTRVPDAPAIIATGPLTSDALAEDIARLTGEPLHFYDAAAPIVTLDSLDMTKVFRASRYGQRGRLPQLPHDAGGIRSVLPRADLGGDGGAARV